MENTKGLNDLRTNCSSILDALGAAGIKFTMDNAEAMFRVACLTAFKLAPKEDFDKLVGLMTRNIHETMLSVSKDRG